MTTQYDLAISSPEIVSIPEESVKAVEAMGVPRNFLPRLQLNNSSGTLCSEKGAKPGTFALVWDANRWTDVGNEINLLAISMRPKALLMEEGENPVAFYDRESEEFKNVVIKMENTPKGTLGGAMAGPEYLLWLPNSNTFATFFCANATLIRVSPNILNLMKQDGRAKPTAMRFQSKFIAPKSSKYKWWGMDVYPLTTPLPEPKEEGWFDKMKAELHKFQNPPKQEVEMAPEDKGEEARER
jgi:hypothetical protein